MIPDNVEKIVMTKQDYDRNVEQLLFDKVKAEQELERYKNIIDELERYLKEEVDSFEEDKYVSAYIEHERLAIKMVYYYLQELKGE